MNTREFDAAVKLAESDADLTNVDDTVLFGYGLPNFKPVVATLAMVAKMLRWQAWQLNGQWDSDALNECRTLFRHRVQIVGG